MIGKKEKIAQFRRDCRSMEFTTKKLIEINAELEDIAYRMQGVSGVSTTDIRCENAAFHDNRIELMEKEKELMILKTEYSSRINGVNRVLLKVSPIMSTIIREVYLQGKRAGDVAYRYGMDKTTMYREMDKELEKLL